MARRLTDLQQEFINQYFLCNLNRTEAAIRAGYKVKNRKSAASIGSENLKKAHIREEIDRRLEENAMAANEVIYRLSEIARSSLADFVEVNPYGQPRFNLTDAPLHQLKKIKIGMNLYGPTLEVELYDAQSALVQLGRYYKLFTDRLEVMDWRAELERAGLNPDDELEALTSEFLKHLDGS